MFVHEIKLQMVPKKMYSITLSLPRSYPTFLMAIDLEITNSSDMQQRIIRNHNPPSTLK